MAKSKIEWTHRPGTIGRTWSPVVGCSKVSPGCDHCYALRQSHRLQHAPSYQGITIHDTAGLDWTGDVVCLPERLSQPLAWQKPSTVFVCSMSDLFHDKVPRSFQCQMFDTMAACPWHTFQVLTKRPGQMAYFATWVWPYYKTYGRPPLDNDKPGRRPLWWKVEGTGDFFWPANVWAGTSVEGQKYAPRLDCLARVPAKVRFVSVEPMLGPVDLRKWLHDEHCSKRPGTKEFAIAGSCHCDCVGQQNKVLSWVIVGGESGPGARPMHPAWARGVRDQCQAASVPFFFKQWGEWIWAPDELNFTRALLWAGEKIPSSPAHQFYSTGHTAFKVGRKYAGAVLDGREWQEWP